MSAILDRCESCRALVDIEDLFCANCGTEVPDRSQTKHEKLSTQAKNFGCANCGASMSYDATAKSLRCPFCGSLDLAEDGTKGVLAPDVILPFEFGQEESIRLMRAWLGSSFWRPNDLNEAAVITDLKAVFVPFWIFRARVRSHWTADSRNVPFGARGEWRPLSGSREFEYADLWIPAGEGVSAKELAAVGPFDATSSVDPSEVDLSGKTVEQFSAARKYVRPLAQASLEFQEAQAVQAELGGAVRNVRVNVLMEDATSKAALVPVYVMAYRYRDRLYRFLMNGRSGKSTGTAPKSFAKVGGAILLAALLAIAGAALIFSS